MKREGSAKRKPVVGVVFVFLMSLAGGGHAYDDVNINVFFGSKKMKKKDWAPLGLENHFEFGVKMDFKNNEWPVSLAVDYFASSEEHSAYKYTDPTYGDIISNNEASTSELAFGVRKTWGSDVIHPFLGGGLALVSAQIDYSTETAEPYCDLLGCYIYLLDYGSDDDQALGLWLDGGVYLTLNEKVDIGLNVRWSKATLFDANVEGGGMHYGIMAGLHF